MAVHPDVEEAFQQIDAMMFSGCPDTVDLDRLQHFLVRWNLKIVRARELIEVGNELLGEEELFYGNECTGEISAVHDYLDSIDSLNDNWIYGRKGKFKICAKVFSTPSDFGIKNGRISKLQICDTSQEHWGLQGCYVNYDRGWDVRPTDPEALEFLNGLLVAFDDNPMADSDLIWYDLYGYETEDDFNNGHRERLGSLDFKDDAMNEAQGYIDHDDQYAVVKVISNDDEEIEILRRTLQITGE